MSAASKIKKSMSGFQKELIGVPESKTDGVYIPWDEKSKSYDVNKLKPECLSNNLSKEDVLFLDSKLKAMSTYDPNPRRCAFYWTPIVIVFFICWFAAAVIFCFVGYFSTVLTTSQQIIILVVVGAVCVLGVLVGLPLVHKVSTSIWRRRKRARLQEAEKIMAQFNSNLMRGKSVSARMAKHGAYLAFEFDGTNGDPSVRERLLQKDRAKRALKQPNLETEGGAADANLGVPRNK